jgi:hypothetical protein
LSTLSPRQAILETYPVHKARLSGSNPGATGALATSTLSQAPLPVSSSMLPSPSSSAGPSVPPLRPGQAPPVTQLAPVKLGPAAVQHISTARNGKKRIRPTNVGGNPSASGLQSAQGSFGGAGPFGGRVPGEPEPEVIRIDASGNKMPPPTAVVAQSAVPTRLQPAPLVPSHRAPINSSESMDVDDPAELNGRPTLARQDSAEATWTVDSRPSSREPSATAAGKRKAIDEGGPSAPAPAPLINGSRVKGRTLGEGVRRTSGVERELRPAGAEGGSGAGGVAHLEGGHRPSADVLRRLSVRSVLKAEAADEGGDWIEARNSLSGESKEDGNACGIRAEGSLRRAGPAEVIHHTPSQVSWLDYLPAPVVALVFSSLFSAFACDDSSLSIYSPTGRRLVPMLILDGPAVVMNGNGKGGLSVVTSRGTLYSWCVSRSLRVMKASELTTSVAHLRRNMRLRSSTLPAATATPNVGHLLAVPDTAIHHSLLRPNGTTVLVLSSGIAVAWSSPLGAWAVLSSRWHSAGSSFWDLSGRVRSSTAASGRGIIAAVESSLNELPAPFDVPDREAAPEWWESALSLGHLEGRLQACVALGASGEEYRRFLRNYAEKIADEGFRAKGEELIRDLVGPTVALQCVWPSPAARVAHQADRPPCIAVQPVARRLDDSVTAE